MRMSIPGGIAACAIVAAVLAPLSTPAFAGGRLSSSGIKVGSPTAGRFTSSDTKKLTQTSTDTIRNMSGRTAIQGRPARKPAGTAAVRRGGCEEWACGSSNGTKLTGIVQETVAATGAVVIGVMLPSGETIDLR